MHMLYKYDFSYVKVDTCDGTRLKLLYYKFI